MRAVPQLSMATGVVPGGEIIKFKSTIDTCGSGLAREDIGTSDIAAN